MTNQNNKKEAARKKSLGELGELFAIKALVDKKFDKTEYFCHYHSMICYRCIVNKVRRPMYDLSGNFKSACTFHWLDYDFVCDECRIDIPPSDIITCTSCDNDFIGTFVEIPYHGCDDNIKYPGFD